MVFLTSHLLFANCSRTSGTPGSGRLKNTTALSLKRSNKGIRNRTSPQHRHPAEGKQSISKRITSLDSCALSGAGPLTDHQLSPQIVLIVSPTCSLTPKKLALLPVTL